MKHLNWLKEKETECDERISVMAETDRGDDIDIEKIKKNIYGVCRTVYTAFGTKYSAEDFEKAYRTKLKEFEDVWTTAKVTAEKHGKGVAGAIEEIKLEVLAEIKNNYAKG